PSSFHANHQCLACRTNRESQPRVRRVRRSIGADFASDADCWTKGSQSMANLDHIRARSAPGREHPLANTSRQMDFRAADNKATNSSARPRIKAALQF